MMIQIDTPVQNLSGVGPKRSQMFAQAGIYTVEDLLKTLPFRYEDRTHFCPISELKLEQAVVVRGRVVATAQHTTPRKRIRVFQLTISDGSGELKIGFFRQPYLGRVFRKEQIVVLYGIPRRDYSGSGLTLMNPEFEILEGGSEASLHSGRIVPIYRKVGKMSTRILRQMVFRSLNQLPLQLEDLLPSFILSKHKFPTRREAFQEIHFPNAVPGMSMETQLSYLASRQTPSHERLIFEEFFLFQLGLQIKRAQYRRESKKRVIQVGPEIREAAGAIFPFQPTSAQDRVFEEIANDLSGPKTMNRLLQGDVGSGKTMVALQAMIVMIKNGYQTVLMVPTEILAEQHHSTLVHYLRHTSCRVALLTGSVRGKERQSLLHQIRSGEVDLVIGTHAVIQRDVHFNHLGLVVIDEQQRFGVIQRSKLVEKGSRPERLVMTATPIPRSLALTLYGDLDVSVLDELPPGRKPSRTIVRTEEGRSEAYSIVDRELKKGRQAFVVYPLIEESEQLDLRGASAMAEHFQSEVFPNYNIGLVHGRLKFDQRERLMHRFQVGELHLLVATTVIEVGVDIPNASVMLIEHADRFGLSQLHQLRGRVSRGEFPGTCILMTVESCSPEAHQRLEIMCKSTDGFEIAEKDLEIRGPGELIGTRQSGLPGFWFADIVRDHKLLESAREEALNQTRIHTDEQTLIDYGLRKGFLVCCLITDFTD